MTNGNVLQWVSTIGFTVTVPAVGWFGTNVVRNMNEISRITEAQTNNAAQVGLLRTSLETRIVELRQDVKSIDGDIKGLERLILKMSNARP